MFKRMVRIELHRALHGAGMKFVLAVGFVLALEHFIFRIVPQMRQMFVGYHPDLAFTTIRSFQDTWMGTICMENNVYKVIVPLLAVIPYAGSFYTDRKRGIMKNICTRVEKKEYMAAKSTAVFISAGIAAVFPFIVSMILTSAVMPVFNYVWTISPLNEGLFAKLSLHYPILNYFCMMAIMFVFAGLIAGLTLSLSLYADNLFVVLSFPFLLYQISDRLMLYIGNSVGSAFVARLQLYHVFSIDQSAPTGTGQLAILFIVLLAAGYLAFIIKGAKKDVL